MAGWLPCTRRKDVRMADYTTAPEVRAMVSDSDMVTEGSYDALLGTFISAASRLIDRYVGGWDNYFVASDEHERWFDGSGERKLWIDAAVSITAVDDHSKALVIDTDYVEFPYNHRRIGRPITRLDLLSGRFSSGARSIKITGVWGYSEEPPETIAMACRIQSMRWFLRAKGGFEDAQASAAVGQMFYTQELDPDVKLLLEPYRVENTVL